LYVTGGSFPWYTPTNVTEIYDPVSNMLDDRHALSRLA